MLLVFSQCMSLLLPAPSIGYVNKKCFGISGKGVGVCNKRKLRIQVKILAFCSSLKTKWHVLQPQRRDPDFHRFYACSWKYPVHV